MKRQLKRWSVLLAVLSMAVCGPVLLTGCDSPDYGEEPEVPPAAVEGEEPEVPG